MKKKPLMPEAIIKKEERYSDGINYSYELSMRKSENPKIDAALYSINVKMTDLRGNSTTANAKEVFTDPGHAILFFDKIVNSLATPVDLAYVVEDELR